MREKFIEIYDNLIPPQLQDEIETTSLTDFPWYYLQNITTTTGDYAPGFTHNLVKDSVDVYPQDSFSDFYNNVLYHLAVKRNILIEKIFSSRLFLHLPSPNPIQDIIHNDLDFPHWVCLYYITDSDGDTVLFEDDNKTEIKRITPKKGRIVFFDGSIPHCSTKPKKNTRVIVNFDFNGTFFG